jgi:hypothetical protein
MTNIPPFCRRPIHPLQRDDFLRTLAVELERHSVGPGLVHRLAADLQRKFVRGTRRRQPSHRSKRRERSLKQSRLRNTEANQRG